MVYRMTRELFAISSAHSGLLALGLLLLPR
jgi:hypothetical protein